MKVKCGGSGVMQLAARSPQPARPQLASAIAFVQQNIFLQKILFFFIIFIHFVHFFFASKCPKTLLGIYYDQRNH